MRCWLFTFTMSMALINYILGIPVDDTDLKYEVHGSDIRLHDDYTSGDNGGKPKLLSGILKKSVKRSLVVGDTFTPQEMLPIAEKLFNKVEEPGSGRGFVSSTKGPRELADKLFEAFFLDTKRIVTLKAHDIIGIDALQALALEGEAADNSIRVEEVTEPAKKMYLRGQIVDIEKSKHLRSHYKLVTKVIPQNMKKTGAKEKRRGIPLAKKLPPKRHLVVNKRPQRRKRPLKNNNKKRARVGVSNKRTKNRSPAVGKTAKEEKKKANCHWKYVCSTPGDLDTCRVQTTCGDSNTLVTSVQKQNDKQDKLVDQFRRMVGITAVDEEVEKILEIRNLKLRPVNLEPIERVESLAEFFNNIIVRENMETTNSMVEHYLTAPINPITPPGH